MKKTLLVLPALLMAGSAIAAPAAVATKTAEVKTAAAKAVAPAKAPKIAKVFAPAKTEKVADDMATDLENDKEGPHAKKHYKGFCERDIREKHFMNPIVVPLDEKAAEAWRKAHPTEAAADAAEREACAHKHHRHHH